MGKLIPSAIVAATALCAVAGTYYFHEVSLRRAEEAAKAERQSALADDAEITKGQKTYWDLKTRAAELENDKTRLSNARMEYDIAGLEGARRNTNEIQKYLAIVQNDEDALRLIDTDELMVLTPSQVDKRIDEHNRKYPNYKIAPTSDITKELEDFNSRIRSVIDQSNDKLRGATGK